jgi:hypothetical protein
MEGPSATAALNTGSPCHCSTERWIDCSIEGGIPCDRSTYRAKRRDRHSLIDHRVDRDWTTNRWTHPDCPIDRQAHDCSINRGRERAS